MALGSSRRWFRYHPLLVDLLRHRLLLDDPELAVELHRRASHWFAGRGEAVEAVRHAVRAHDWDLVGELIVGGAALRAVSAEPQGFASLLAEIPAQELRATPELRVSAAIASFIARDYPGFRNHVDHARALLRQDGRTARGPIEGSC